jgi:riboflavin transporter FmnP
MSVFTFAVLMLLLVLGAGAGLFVAAIRGILETWRGGRGR